MLILTDMKNNAISKKQPGVALCQMEVTLDKSANLLKAGEMISGSAVNGADIVVLPEMFNCPYSSRFFPEFAESFPGETTDMLSGLAKKHSIYIIGGSIPEKEKDKIYNSSFAFDRDGKLLGRHRKIHLFDVSIGGGVSFMESDTISAGRDFTIIDTEFCKIGIAICYDMRFPELIRKMTLEGAMVIVVPAAFNMTTGPVHWHLTARARALDNQVYFIAVSPSRNESSGYGYVAYGHSLVADPWGKIIAEAGTGEEILNAIIDLDYIYKIRKELPLLNHLRQDLY